MHTQEDVNPWKSTDDIELDQGLDTAESKAAKAPKQVSRLRSASIVVSRMVHIVAAIRSQTSLRHPGFFSKSLDKNKPIMSCARSLQLHRWASLGRARAKGRSVIESAEKWGVVMESAKDVEFWRQGDPSLYSAENLVKRSHLKNADSIEERIMKFYFFFTFDQPEKTIGMSKESYLRGNVIFFEVLITSCGDQYLESEALKSALDDWKADAGEVQKKGRRIRKSHISEDAFKEALFELVDNWTQTTELGEYVEFLDRMWDSFLEIWDRKHGSASRILSGVSKSMENWLKNRNNLQKSRSISELERDKFKFSEGDNANMASDGKLYDDEPSKEPISIFIDGNEVRVRPSGRFKPARHFGYHVVLKDSITNEALEENRNGVVIVRAGAAYYSDTIIVYIDGDPIRIPQSGMINPVRHFGFQTALFQDGKLVETDNEGFVCLEEGGKYTSSATVIIDGQPIPISRSGHFNPSAYFGRDVWLYDINGRKLYEAKGVVLLIPGSHYTTEDRNDYIYIDGKPRILPKNGHILPEELLSDGGTLYDFNGEACKVEKKGFVKHGYKVKRGEQYFTKPPDNGGSKALGKFDGEIVSADQLRALMQQQGSGGGQGSRHGGRDGENENPFLNERSGLSEAWGSGNWALGWDTVLDGNGSKSARGIGGERRDRSRVEAPVARVKIFDRERQAPQTPKAKLPSRQFKHDNFRWKENASRLSHLDHTSPRPQSVATEFSVSVAGEDSASTHPHVRQGALLPPQVGVGTGRHVARVPYGGSDAYTTVIPEGDGCVLINPSSRGLNVEDSFASGISGMNHGSPTVQMSLESVSHRTTLVRRPITCQNDFFNSDEDDYFELPENPTGRPLSTRQGLRHETTFNTKNTLLDSVLSTDVDEKVAYRCPAHRLSIKDKVLPWEILAMCRNAPSRYAAFALQQKRNNLLSSITYREFGRHIFYVAQNLMGHYGFKKGDVMGMAANGSVDYMVMYFAVGLCGGVCALYTQPLKERTLGQQIGMTKPRFIFATTTDIDAVNRTLNKPNKRFQINMVDGIIVAGGVHPASQNIDFMLLKRRVKTNMVPFKLVDPDRDIALISFAIEKEAIGSMRMIRLGFSQCYSAFQQARGIVGNKESQSNVVTTLQMSDPHVLNCLFPMVVSAGGTLSFGQVTDFHAEQKDVVNPLLLKEEHEEYAPTHIVTALPHLLRVLEFFEGTAALNKVYSIEVAVESECCDVDTQVILSRYPGINQRATISQLLIQPGGLVVARTVLSVNPKQGEVGHLMPNTTVKILMGEMDSHLPVTQDGQFEPAIRKYASLRDRHTPQPPSLSIPRKSRYSTDFTSTRMRSIRLGDSLASVTPLYTTRQLSTSSVASSHHYSKIASHTKDEIKTESLDPLHIGEVWVKGPQVTRSRLDYLEDKEKTFVDVEQIGYTSTGQVGYIDLRGSLILVPASSIYPSGVVPAAGQGFVSGQ